MFNKEPKIRIDFKNLSKPYRLMNTIRYSDSDTCFTIRYGYSYDGCTIPRIFWSLVGSKGDVKMLRPALVHDYMCERKKRFSVQLSTKVFYRLLVHYGTSKLKANIMCLFVFVWQLICRGFDYATRSYKRMQELFRV